MRLRDCEFREYVYAPPHFRQVRTSERVVLHNRRSVGPGYASSPRRWNRLHLARSGLESPPSVNSVGLICEVWVWKFEIKAAALNSRILLAKYFASSGY